MNLACFVESMDADAVTLLRTCYMKPGHEFANDCIGLVGRDGLLMICAVDIDLLFDSSQRKALNS